MSTTLGTNGPAFMGTFTASGNPIYRPAAMTPTQPSATPTTPRTDAEEFVATTWDYIVGEETHKVVDSSFARTLETELAEAKAECERLALELTVIGNLAVGLWDDSTVGRVDAAVPLEKQRTYKDVLKKLFDAPAELARLRAEVEKATAKIANQAERIRYLEGATNHATGTPLSLATERAERAESALALYRSKVYRVKSILASIDDDGTEQHTSAAAEQQKDWEAKVAFHASLIEELKP